MNQTTLTHQLHNDRNTSKNECWREMLFTAFSGIYSTDQQLERFFDHLERVQ